MIKKIRFKGKSAFQCGVCGLMYAEKETAEQCEAFCKTHPNMCDPKIAEKSIH